ncbi:Unknown protein [Striga hermonthica]|uniref:Uncharacterized protein n=1 Tax=Striga hermonthica TaxID=68872 RepID=A0A9N7NJG9_STRHE|nr:Unknown protein [Striga hermonthica]
MSSKPSFVNRLKTELESSITRQAADDVTAYVSSRKKVNSMVNKYIVKNSKTFNQNASPLTDIGKMLKEPAESIGVSVLRSVLTVLSSQKQNSSKKSWSSFLTKLTETSRIHSETKQESEAEELR